VNNYQPRRYRKFEKIRSRLNFKRVIELNEHRRLAKFRQKLLDRARYWDARRIMQAIPDKTLAQARVMQFLDELRRNY
jgi:hypothetical protein